MASEEELRKINVRSPYFVNVTKPVSLGGVEPEEPVDPIDGGDTGGGEEPFVEPTEPTVTTTTISCGDTRNIGFGVGINRYEFSTIGKQIGDYDINFSNIKVPFYAKIGIKGNMPSEYTFMVGHSGYDSNWLDAVGTPVPSSTTISSHPDGNDQTITYTSTQSDIDTYGETVLLEVFHPVINIENIQFTVDCPNAVVSVTEDSGQGSVFIMTIYNRSIDPYKDLAIPNKLNGVDASWLVLPEKGETTSYVFGIHNPDLQPFYLNQKHLDNVNVPLWNDQLKHNVVYRPANSINQKTNVFEFNQQTTNLTGFSFAGAYYIDFSTHRLENWTGDTRVNDKAFITLNADRHTVNGNINYVSRTGLQDANKAGSFPSTIGALINKQTFTINRRGTDDLTFNNTNYLESGTVKLEAFNFYSIQTMNQSFALGAFPEKL